MYNPVNVNVYGAALAGSLSGMAVFGNQPSSVDPAIWASMAAEAGAWAQLFDTTWGVAEINSMSLQLIESVSNDFWAARNPKSVSDSTLWGPSVNSLIEVIRAAGIYNSDQGVTPAPIPSTQTVSFHVTPDDTPNQTIATSAVLPDNSTTVVDVEIIGKQIGAAEAVSTKIQYTYYRNGSGPQQAGNKTEIVPVTGTLNIATSTFDITASGNALIIRASPSIAAPIFFKTIFTLTST